MRRADKKNKPQWFLDNVSPKGSVPVLRHGDKMIPDSKSIVQYIKATWKKPELASMSRAVKKLEKCGITDIMYQLMLKTSLTQSALSQSILKRRRAQL